MKGICQLLKYNFCLTCLLLGNTCLPYWSCGYLRWSLRQDGCLGPESKAQEWPLHLLKTCHWRDIKKKVLKSASIFLIWPWTFLSQNGTRIPLLWSQLLLLRSPTKRHQQNLGLVLPAHFTFPCSRTWRNSLDCFECYRQEIATHRTLLDSSADPVDILPSPSDIIALHVLCPITELHSYPFLIKPKFQNGQGHCP